jgi:hypothetical protein
VIVAEACAKARKREREREKEELKRPTSHQRKQRRHTGTKCVTSFMLTNFFFISSDHHQRRTLTFTLLPLYYDDV